MSTLLWWLALGLPAIYQLNAYAFGDMSYGQFIHNSGQWSIGLLLLALSVSPLRALFSRASSSKTGSGLKTGLQWLGQHRRAIGVASFIYALLHTLVYLNYKWGSDLILLEGMRPGLATAWLGLFLMLLLALSSNDYSVQRLGRRWKALHNWVHIAAALSFAHWLLSTVKPVPALLCLLILATLQLARTFKRRQTH